MDAIKVIKSGLQNSKNGIARTMNGLTEEEINWHPRPDANSIGLILFHVARSEDGLLNGMILGGKPQLWETGKWYEKLGKAIDDGGAHYTAEQVENFVTPNMADLNAYADAVHAQTMAYLDSLKPEDLDGKLQVPEGFPFEPVVGVLLTLIVTHAAQHVGEVSYIRGLKRGMDK